MKGTLLRVTLAASLLTLAGGSTAAWAAGGSHAQPGHSHPAAHRSGAVHSPAWGHPRGAVYSHPREHERFALRGGLWWGSPWWGSPWYDPYWYGPYATRPPVVQVVPRGVALIDLDVHPRRATVIVDGTPVGRARDFGPNYRPLLVKRGPHVIELQCPGYQTTYLAVNTGRIVNRTLHFRLEKGTGIDERSTAPGPTARSRS